MKVIFAGTPEFAALALQALIDSEHEVLAVLTQPDRPGGRGRKPQASPVKNLALNNDIPVLQPPKLTPDTCSQVMGFDPDIVIVAAYGLIIPTTLLEWPSYGCINIHASLLPRWRGAAPIQRAILAGDKTTGITIMQMDAGLDTGDMLLKESLEINDTDNAQALHDKLASMGAMLNLKALESIASGQIKAEPQDNSQATYAAKLSKNEGVLDWQQPAEQLHRQIRALTPWPGCFSYLAQQRIKIIEAQPGPQLKQSHQPGQIHSLFEGDLLVACQNGGSLKIKNLQIAGKRAMSAVDAINGHPHWIENKMIFSCGPL